MMDWQQAYSDMTVEQLRRAYVDAMNGKGGGWQQAQSASSELQRRASPSAASPASTGWHERSFPLPPSRI